MPGRKLVERLTLFAFVAALSVAAVVFLSRGNVESPPTRVTAPPRVSEALGTNIQRTAVAPTSTPTLEEILTAADVVQRARDFYTRIITPTPTFQEILIAADTVQQARDFYDRITTPTPTLQQILIAADEVNRAQDFFAAVAEPTPTLEETLRAADQLARFSDYAQAVSTVEASAPPPAAPQAAPQAVSTPLPVAPTTAPPPPSTSTPLPQAFAPQSAPIQNAGNGYYDLAFENQVLALVNQRRASEGLPALAVEPLLTHAARGYGKVLADNDWFSHTGPDGSDLVSRIEAAGLPFTVQFGEVLAWGSNGWPPKDIVQAWMDSPAHRDQILGSPYARAGVGCYFTKEGSLTVRCVIDFAG